MSPRMVSELTDPVIFQKFYCQLKNEYARCVVSVQDIFRHVVGIDFDHVVFKHCKVIHDPHRN